MEKQCNDCNRLLNLELFVKDKSRKTGYKNICKECFNVRQRKTSKIWRKENLGHKNEYLKKYHYENKERFKNINSEKAREYYKKNKEMIDKKHRIYRQTEEGRIINCKISNKRRCLIKNCNESYTKEQWIKCIEFFNGECAYSGVLLDSDNIQVEHIIPLSKDGENSIKNIVPALDKVNYSKGIKNMETWYKKQHYYSEERLAKIYKWIDVCKKDLL